MDAECVYYQKKHWSLYSTSSSSRDGAVRVQCTQPAYVATNMLRTVNPSACQDSESDSDSDYYYDDEFDGLSGWLEQRQQRLEKRVQRWLVPSARRYVREALKCGAREYSKAGCKKTAACYTGYGPHTALVSTTIVPLSLFVADCACYSAR